MDFRKHLCRVEEQNRRGGIKFMPLALAAMQQETPEQRAHRIEYINQRWKQLYELEKEWAEKAVKYLLATNSGGAVAVLSFLGASAKARSLTGPAVALSLFLLGVVLVGVFHAYQYHRMSNLFLGWKKDSENYFAYKINWDLLTEEDEKRTKPSRFAYALCYGAFLSFIVGCICGAITIFQ